MARVASHRYLAAERVLVDVPDHRNHLSCGLFDSLVVLGPIFFQMAEVAVYAECCTEEAHFGEKLIDRSSLEHLDILVHLLGCLACRTGRWLLGGRDCSCGKYQHKSSTDGSHGNNR